MSKLTKYFWEERYKNNQTGWDIGSVSTPLKEYIDQLINKNLKILIPGVGNGYEAEYLWKQGFKNVYVLDIAKHPLDNLQKRIQIPQSHVIHEDFFNLNDTFDLIIEQTFFCALNPKLRKAYSKKMHRLLNKKGKLVGVLFDFELTSQGPPYGGSKEEYLTYFSNLFEIKTLEPAYNSIKPRMNRELFFIFEKSKIDI